eukprot:COSAG03_NODE_1273_length_4422_cov_2.115198_2_plen_67_part_00
MAKMNGLERARGVLTPRPPPLPPPLHTVPCVQCRRNVPFGQFSQFFAVAHERGNTTKDNYGIVALR